MPSEFHRNSQLQCQPTSVSNASLNLKFGRRHSRSWRSALFEKTFFLGQERERLALILLCNRADLGNHQVSSAYGFLHPEYPDIWSRRDRKTPQSGRLE
jgi:hypothetical protein